MKIVNLTRHTATPEQRRDGVVDLPVADRTLLLKLLDFKRAPDRRKVFHRAAALAALAARYGARAAMIGGAPYLMGPLEAELRLAGVRPLYSYGTRIAFEVVAPDGSVRKTSIFRHERFVAGATIACTPVDARDEKERFPRKAG